MSFPKCKIHSFVNYSNTYHTQTTFIRHFRLNGRCLDSMVQSNFGRANPLKFMPPVPCSLAEESNRHTSECLFKQHREDWEVQRTISLTLGGRSGGSLDVLVYTAL